MPVTQRAVGVHHSRGRRIGQRRRARCHRTKVRAVIRRRHLISARSPESAGINRDVIVVRQIQIRRRVQRHPPARDTDLRRISDQNIECVDRALSAKAGAAVIHDVNVLASHRRHALTVVEHQIRAHLQIAHTAQRTRTQGGYCRRHTRCRQRRVIPCHRSDCCSEAGGQSRLGIGRMHCAISEYQLIIQACCAATNHPHALAITIHCATEGHYTAGNDFGVIAPASGEINHVLTTTKQGAIHHTTARHVYRVDPDTAHHRHRHTRFRRRKGITG